MSKNFTITVPSTVVPTISAVSLSEAVSGLATQFGGYVQGKSKIAAKITASGVYSSTIKAYKTTIQGANFTAASFTSGFLTKSGTSTVTITVTDSRGRTASTTRSITVITYSAPKITSFQGFRSLQNGTENYEGTYLNAAVNFSISAVSNKNTASYTVEYRLKNAESWTALTSGSVYALNSNIVSASGFMSTENSYDIRLSVTDYFTTVRSTFEIPTAFTLLDFNASGRGLAFGKVSELEDGMEVDMDMSIYKDIFMGGSKRTDDEKNMHFQTSETAQYIHNCKLYGGNGTSVTSIGCWDTERAHGIWRYLSSTQNLVFDANVKVTRANGGDEFITSEPVVHGNRSGRAYFSNGLLIQWGAETITPVSGTPTSKAVKFSAAYASVPAVITSAVSAVPGTVVLGTAPANVTVTGFDAYVTRTGTTDTVVGWIAIGYKTT